MEAEQQFEIFRARVLSSPVLLDRLRNVPPEQFMAEALAASRELGIPLTREELEAALQQARREARQHWM